MAKITTIDGLIDALGGPSKLGDTLGIGQSAVSNWPARGFIPPAWHFRLFIELSRHDLTIDPNVFDMTEEEAAPLMAKVRPKSRPLAGAAA